MRIIFAAPFGALLACLPVAVSAHHMGASAFDAGGGLTVFSPETLDGKHWSLGMRLLYTRPDRRSDLELETLAGQHVRAHDTNANFDGAVGVAYGVSHHLTISAELPYVRRDGLREGSHSHSGGQAVNSVVALGNVSGIGDLNLLAKYRLTEEGPLGFAVIAGIKAPTGSTHRRSLDGERLETEHQPGTGSWDPIFGASASARMGEVQLTASGLFQLATTGAQRTRLGNRFTGGVALSHRFGRRAAQHLPSHSHHHGDELDEHHARPHSNWDAFVELAGEWEGKQRIAGEVEPASGGKWMWVAPGVRFNAASGWSASAGVAIPIWQRIGATHPDNRYRLAMTLSRAF